MLTHDQTIYVIQRIHPQAIHGRDFWVAHPLGPDGKQAGTARIVAWHLPAKPPTLKAIQAAWQKYQPDFARDQMAAQIRSQRALRLLEADQLINKARDAGDARLEAAAASYRQALREITAQDGFPFEVVWPRAPDVEMRSGGTSDPSF